MSKRGGSRRARRRMRAQLRDLAVHGTKHPSASAVPSMSPQMSIQSAIALVRAMMPNPGAWRRHSQSAAVKARSYQVLQRIEAGRPKGKRTVRYTSVSPWRGVRIGDADAQARAVRVLPPKRRKGA